MLKNVCWSISPRRNDISVYSDLQNNHILEETFEFSDLGLFTSGKLSWNAHVDKITSKANKFLGLVKRTCKGMKDITALRTLFCALVRSQLEHCTVVWSPQTARNINKLDKIQKRATKFILKSDDDYNMHRKTKFVVFGRHMLFVSVLFLSKVPNRYIGIDISTYTQFYTDSDRYHFRRRDELTLKRTFVRTTTFKSSFFK